MAETPPPRSPSLEPPRKSTELEDPGAHSLENTSDEDEFSDAREALASPTRPITRVERVDSLPAHGEVPGTAAYEQRSQDAQPDRIAIRPDGHGPEATDAETTDRAPADDDLVGGKPSVPVPKTVITRVDSEPAHGEVPGTKAAAMRAADAKPDVLEKREDPPSKPAKQLKAKTIPDRSRSPIAADGGFGDPPSSDEEGDENETDLPPKPLPTAINTEPEVGGQWTEDDGFGDDFDDFAEGEEADDFGDFDEGLEPPEEPVQEPETTRRPSIAPVELPFPILNFSSNPSLSEIQEMLSPHLNTLFPAAELARDAEPPASLPEGNTAFLSERSYSLWQQLIQPPPLQPPNWVRSRIRRLFLVSLGVPVDLDEILPKSKQKKLVLSYDPADQTKGGSKSKTATNKDQPSKRTRGPPPPPEFDVVEVKKLCGLTDADLDEMTDEALQLHVKTLEGLSSKGKEVLQYWVKRKEMAVDEKEAFDSVVESLVRHARRVRK